MRLSLVILTAVAFFLGFMASDALSTPKPVRIENMPYCLHSEYGSMKELYARKPPLDSAMVTVGSVVRVWVRCDYDSFLPPNRTSWARKAGTGLSLGNASSTEGRNS